MSSFVLNVGELYVTVFGKSIYRNIDSFVQNNTILSPIFFFFLYAFSRATPAAYGSPQSRGPIRAIAAGLCHAHSSMGFQLHMQPTPQLTATSDP